MKHIIHNWDEERTLTMLKNYHQAMTENDLLKEMLMLTDNRPSSSKWLDLTGSNAKKLVFLGSSDRSLVGHEAIAI